MNLNYDNLVQSNAVNGARSATNFFAWRPVDFFTNAADRLLRAYSAAWLQADPVDYMATFGTTSPFGVTNIPVFVSGTFTNVRLVSATQFHQSHRPAPPRTPWRARDHFRLHGAAINGKSSPASSP